MNIADTGRDVLGAIPATVILQTARGTVEVSQDMEVVGSDGARVGVLRDVRPDEADILVHRPLLQRDVYIPCDAIEGVLDGALVLTLPAAEVAAQDWPQLPLFGLPEG